MTNDTNHIKVLREIQSAYPSGGRVDDAIDAAITALSARASAGEGEEIAWESTTVGFTHYVTDARYQKFSPEIRRWYKPYRCANCAAAPQPAQAGASGGGVPVGEFQDWFEAWAKEKEEIILHRIADGRLISPTASIAESAFLAGCMTASMYYMELCRNDSTAATQPSEAHTCDFMDGLDDCVACKATPPAHGDGEDLHHAVWSIVRPYIQPAAREKVNAALKEALTTRPTPEAQEARDAARWRALIGSARIRVLGSAGLLTDTRPDGGAWNGYAHIGLELWTKHEAGNEPTDAVEWLTKYTDAALALPAQGEGNNG